MLKIAFAGFGLLCWAASSVAAPVLITQTYSDVTYSPYFVPEGVEYGKTPTGDWVFQGTVDDAAPNVSDEPAYRVYELERLTMTQASLGLFDVGITNVPYLWFAPDRFGFTGTPYGGGAWTATVYEPDHFAGASDLGELLALATTPSVLDPYNSLGPQWEGYSLEDGRHVYGWGFGPSAISTAALPEPATIGLVVLGVFVAIGSGRFAKRATM